MYLSELNLYPIKSTKAYSVSQAWVRWQGLNFDREFMLTEPDGKMISARKDKTCFELAAFPTSTGLIIQHTSGRIIQIFYADFQRQQGCEVWGTAFESWVASEAVNQALSELFGRAVQLRWLGERSPRLHKNGQNLVSFADSNPLMLASTASLAQLQQWSPIALSMAQFRPNLVIEGGEPFAEEGWHKIQIGEVVFQVAEPCTRCVMITRNVQTLELDPQAEPLRTLKQQHTNANGKPIFGVHLIPQNEGVLRVGDPISLLD